MYQLSPPFCTFPLHIDTQDLSFLFMQIVLQSLYVLTLSTFSVPLATVVVQKKKIKHFNLTSNTFTVKFNKSLNMNNSSV